MEFLAVDDDAAVDDLLTLLDDVYAPDAPDVPPELELLAAPDNDAVGALLALVDDVYAPHASALGARARRRHAAARRQALRAQVEQLQETLDAMRTHFASQDAAIDMPRLWARVALRQRKLQQAAAQQNAQLKRAVLQQRALARHVAAVLEEIQSLVQRQATQPTEAVPIEPQSGAWTPPLLRRRLDALSELLASSPVASHARDYLREHDVAWNETQTALRISFRSKALYPFKLSIVADELWRFLQEALPARVVAQDEMYYTDTSFEMRKPFGWMEARGPTAMRRVCTQDGGVLLASVATLKGTETTQKKHNLMTGLAMHETTWIRVVRADPSNPKSLVVVEVVNESDVFVMADEELGGTNPHTSRCGRTPLQQFRAFIEHIAEAEPGQGRQELENRLLDASRARGCD